ncbi:MAG: hypothetical protein C4538_10500 [Nitrospiraceae bacterium]|nr:MAG: hypothetical protein C4538_10500 [Nitrospiraceae bacterium]
MRIMYYEALQRTILVTTTKGNYKMSGSRIFLIILFLFASLIFIKSANAQQTEFSSTLNPVGSGARATGMGGAFIGVADDATAASWNPAGLIQLEKPEMSAVYSYFHRRQKYSSDQHPEIDSVQKMDADGLNYASIAYPFVFLNRNMIISLNYQRLFEMNKDYKFDFIGSSSVDPGSSVSVLTESGSHEFQQDGFLYTLSPAFAVQLLPGLTLGATYNIWDNFFGANGWDSRNIRRESKTTLMPLPAPINGVTVYTESSTTIEEENRFEGDNWHFGVLWSITDSLIIGGVYKTAFDADLEKARKVTNYDINRLEYVSMLPPSETINGPETTATREKFTMRMPASYGVGISYRHSDSLTIAADMYITEWSRFVLRNSEGNETNPLNSVPISKGRLKDTTQARLGMEYLFIKAKYTVPLRFGLFYDPEPATGHLDDFYGISFGTGFASDRIALDMSYQYRFGRNITTDFLAATDSDPDVNQHTLMTSAIFYF